MSLSQDLARAAAAAGAFAEPGEEVAAVIPAEPAGGRRVYLCAFASGGETAGWISLDDAGAPLLRRDEVRDAVSIAALCELAEDNAGGGDLAALRAHLQALETEDVEGLAEAEAALAELERAIGEPPRVATPAHLDAVGGAARRLEHALGETARSPFAEAMAQAGGAVEELLRDVEARYRGTLV